MPLLNLVKCSKSRNSTTKTKTKITEKLRFRLEKILTIFSIFLLFFRICFILLLVQKLNLTSYKFKPIYITPTFKGVRNLNLNSDLLLKKPLKTPEVIFSKHVLIYTFKNIFSIVFEKFIKIVLALALLAAKKMLMVF